MVHTRLLTLCSIRHANASQGGEYITDCRGEMRPVCYGGGPVHETFGDIVPNDAQILNFTANKNNGDPCVGNINSRDELDHIVTTKDTCCAFLTL